MGIHDRGWYREAQPRRKPHRTMLKACRQKALVGLAILIATATAAWAIRQQQARAWAKFYKTRPQCDGAYKDFDLVECANRHTELRRRLRRPTRLEGSDEGGCGASAPATNLAAMGQLDDDSSRRQR